MKIIKTIVFLGCTVAAATSWSYSDAGHKIVASLAWQKLTPFARQNVERILGLVRSNFIEASVWADQIKSDDRYRYLKPMHYVNIPKSSTQYDRKRDCKKGNCVVQAIHDFSNMTRESSEKKQKLALRMLIHLVGDIHQPMHAGLKSDRGGNWFDIEFNEDSTNLHKLWDTYNLIRRIDKDWHKVVEQLVIPAKADVTTPKKWAEESHRLALDVAYQTDEGEPVTESYLKQAEMVTRERLALAGWRLAMWLNRLW